MEALGSFILFAVFSAGFFAAGYATRKYVSRFRKEVKKMQQAPKQVIQRTVTLADVQPQWSTRVDLTQEDGWFCDVSGKVSGKNRTVTVNKRQAERYLMYHSDFIEVGAGDVDNLIVALKAAQLAAQSGPAN